jgi:GNAT superfamily N-acetyltransferase
MDIEFKKAITANELDDLLDFDRRMFSSFPDDLFEPEDWNSLESYWMLADGVKVGCCAFERNCDYDERPRKGCLYIASTGILPEFQGKGLGRKQKEWQIKYARDHGFSVVVTNMRKSNVKMKALNESVGFGFRCFDPDYYTTPDEAAIVMELSLATDNSSDY